MDARVPTTMPETTSIGPTGLVVPPERRPLALSPLNRRRWQNFKRNRRGYFSLWIFLVLFITSLFAEVIANDKPFMVQYNGRVYFPALFTYSETTFGGEFETAADYRDPYRSRRSPRPAAECGGRRSAILIRHIISICRHRPRRSRPGS